MSKSNGLAPKVIQGQPLETQQRLLRAARGLFAERGYHGTSLSAVAGCLGLTKQALLHHFGSKDSLYRAVLTQLDADILDLVFAAMEKEVEPETQLLAFFTDLARLGHNQPDVLRLLLREMIDGTGVQKKQGAAVLTFLEPLVALIQATIRWQHRSAGDALGLAVHLLGAVCLFPSAQVVISRSFSGAVIESAQHSEVDKLRHLVRQVLDLG